MKLTWARSAVFILLLAAVPAFAEQTASPSTLAPALKIIVLDGEGARNSISEPAVRREPIIEVEDEEHRPVAGATVQFSVDSGVSGAGGSFLNGANTFSGLTDADGRIRAAGFHPNEVAGAFRIEVTARKGQLISHTTISQLNIFALPTQGVQPPNGITPPPIALPQTPQDTAPRPQRRPEGPPSLPTAGAHNEYSLGDQLQKWKESLASGAVEYRVPGSMTAQQISSSQGRQQILRGYRGRRDHGDQERPSLGLRRWDQRKMAHQRKGKFRNAEYETEPRPLALERERKIRDSPKQSRREPGFHTAQSRRLAAFQLLTSNPLLSQMDRVRNAVPAACCENASAKMTCHVESSSARALLCVFIAAPFSAVSWVRSCQTRIGPAHHHPYTTRGRCAPDCGPQEQRRAGAN